jgi:hypothetical protein
MTKASSCGLVTPTELARLFGVARSWVYELVEKGMPREGRHFDAAACVQWYLAELKGSGTEDPEDLAEARKRLYIAQTVKTELENEKLRGQHVDVDEALQVLYGVASVVATQHDAVGPRVAALIIGKTDIKEVQTILFDEHRAIREAIADAIIKLPRPGRGDSETPAKKNRGRVGRRKQDPAAGKS